MTLETIAPLAMIRSSRCRHWQRDAAAQPAQEHSSYTTRWGTIQDPSGSLPMATLQQAESHYALKR